VYNHEHFHLTKMMGGAAAGRRPGYIRINYPYSELAKCPTAGAEQTEYGRAARGSTWHARDCPDVTYLVINSICTNFRERNPHKGTKTLRARSGRLHERTWRVLVTKCT
jgi:hypothetical protein